MSQFVARVGRSVVVLVMAVALAGAASCTSPTSPTFRADFEKIDLVAGTGAEAASGATALVNYTGWLYDNTKTDKKGDQFDASPAGQPFVFQLGAGQVISGWDVGIIGMKVGGKRRLIIPSQLAYGRQGAGDRIPPNATLVFDIELVSLATQ
jgi:FKBP-type peptidyl-prolyl cis-trans isomerase FkpA